MPCWNSSAPRYCSSIRRTAAPFSYVRTSNMPSASSGRPTVNSTGGCSRGRRRRIAADRPMPKLFQRCHSGPERVDGQHLHERGERLVEPDAVPPLHRHEVAEPHVGDLVGDDVGDPLELGVRRRCRVSTSSAVSRKVIAPEVLHRAERRSRAGRSGRACRPGTGCRSSRRRSAARTRRPPGRSRPGGACPGRRRSAAAMPSTSTASVASSCPTTKATRYVDIVHRVGERRRRACRCRASVSVDLRPFETAIRPSSTTSVTAKTALQVGLVPAREGAPGVGGLELGGRDDVLLAVGVGVACCGRSRAACR